MSQCNPCPVFRQGFVFMLPGITIEVADADRLLKFCGIGHYLQWWKLAHPGVPLKWDYPEARGKPEPASGSGEAL